MIGALLGDIISQVKDEVGYANNPALSTNAQRPIAQRVRRLYRQIHGEWDWPHLVIERYEELAAGHRYYTMPLDLDNYRAITAWSVRKDDDRWHKMHYGISPKLYNLNVEEKEYPTAWDMFEEGQYEVWPTPSTTGARIRFYGMSKPKTLAEESDPVDLDDQLLVLLAASELLAKDQQPHAQVLMQQATARYTRLKAQGTKREPFRMGGNVRREELMPSLRFAETADRDL